MTLWSRKGIAPVLLPGLVPAPKDFSSFPIPMVPAGEGWDFDPFCGEISNGIVYGRGALDCKGLMAAQIYTLLRLAWNPVPLTAY